jgi:hypothetical protein
MATMEITCRHCGHSFLTQATTAKRCCQCRRSVRSAPARGEGRRGVLRMAPPRASQRSARRPLMGAAHLWPYRFSRDSFG